MERRLRLHEKIKSSPKLNKMTVKQGDVLVTLNLKQDIGDPNVEISDKVLYMLEQFVEKQQSKQLNSSIKVVTTASPTLSSNEDTTTTNKKTTPKSVNNSPSKRVRFDLNPVQFKSPSPDNQITNEEEIVKNDQLNTNKTVENNLTTITNNDSTQIETNKTLESSTEPIVNKPDTNDLNKLENSTIKNTENASSNEIPKSTKKVNQKKAATSQVQANENDDEDEEEQNLLFNCRLCRLKFNNQRGLHEHVARIHGGKGGSFNLSLFSDNTNQEDDYDETTTNCEDDDYEYEDDDDESNDPYNYQLPKSSKNRKQIWNNQFKKKKLPHSNLPYPNVAIRVAKVAYYNSKIGQTAATSTNQSNTNAFKSSIFTNGGIRGNFFSQERLPLRSCKIKMKLTQSQQPSKSTNEIEIDDKFLSHFNILKEFKPIDRNTTVTYQTSTTNNIDDDILTDQEVRSFFKSLLVYIPLDTSTDVIRLDDLIKLSQESEEGFLNEKLLVDSLRLIHEIIMDAKQFGISLFDLKKSYLNRISGAIQLKMDMILALVQLMIDNFLVLAVGVVHRVYVAHEFKQHWVIESCKNQKGRGYANLEADTKQLEDGDSDVIEEKRSPTKKIDKKSSESISFSRNFKPVCLVPRPWRYIDGLLNRPVLQKMFETILIYLKSYPNATLENIAAHFCPVLQPVMTLELLEMLEKCKCIGKTYLKKEENCDLSSDFLNGSKKILNEENLDGNELTTYDCRPNSIFTIKKLFQSSNAC